MMISLQVKARLTYSRVFHGFTLMGHHVVDLFVIDIIGSKLIDNVLINFDASSGHALNAW